MAALEWGCFFFEYIVPWRYVKFLTPQARIHFTF